jgi:hypothetical protein
VKELGGGPRGSSTPGRQGRVVHPGRGSGGSRCLRRRRGPSLAPRRFIRCNGHIRGWRPRRRSGSIRIGGAADPNVRPAKDTPESRFCQVSPVTDGSPVFARQVHRGHWPGWVDLPWHWPTSVADLSQITTVERSVLVGVASRGRPGTPAERAHLLPSRPQHHRGDPSPVGPLEDRALAVAAPTHLALPLHLPQSNRARRPWQ